jgi:hypothetical protein
MARRDWGMDLHYEWLTGLNSMHHQHSAIPLNMMIVNQFKPNINTLTSLGTSVADKAFSHKTSWMDEGSS